MNMEFSYDFSELATALAKAQGHFAKVTKSRTASIPGKDGKQGYTYDYADLSDVLAAVVPALSAEGLCIIQAMGPGPSVGWACVETRLLHTSGQFVIVSLDVPVAGTSPQAIGSAFTYGRRYALCGLLGVAAEEDDDGQAARGPSDNGRRDDRDQRPADRQTQRQSSQDRGPPANRQQQDKRQQQERPADERRPADTKPADQGKATTTQATSQQRDPAVAKTAQETDEQIRARGTRYIVARDIGWTKERCDALSQADLIVLWKKLVAEVKAAMAPKADTAKTEKTATPG
jgi:hypothetical protein